jgi:alpha/beta superfamily hydrolase
MPKLALIVAALACAALLTGCGTRITPDPELIKKGWRSFRLPATPYVLTGYGPPPPFRAQALTVYIEGDSPPQARNPNPSPAMGRHLALADPGSNVVYLARPCQFVVGAADSVGCTGASWGVRRFATEAVESMHQALDLLKQQTGAQKLRLVGYGGGGIMAALLAARRVDVPELVTVAAPLDAERWAAPQRAASPDPNTSPHVDMARLRFVQQVHFVGDSDPLATTPMLDAFAASQPAGKRVDVIMIQKADHYCCWVQNWPHLLQTAETLFAWPSNPTR